MRDGLSPSGPRHPLRQRRLGMAVAACLLVLAASVGAAALSGGDRSGRASGGSAPAGSASAAVPAPATIWAVGDGADGSAAGRRVGGLIAAGRPNRFLYLGDVYERGTSSDFARHYAPLFGRFGRRSLPTPGNHDWPRHARGYDPYWQRVMGRTVGGRYALSAGGWEILSLNSETVRPGSAQIRWLHDRAVRGSNCRIAFWHRPRYSAGSHGDQSDVEPFWQELRGRAALVLNGHEHNMQDFRVRGGIRELIAGSGGHGHYGLNTRDSRLAWSSSSRYGALRLRLRPGRADYAFVATDGTVLRRGSVGCSR